MLAIGGHRPDLDGEGVEVWELGYSRFLHLAARRFPLKNDPSLPDGTLRLESADGRDVVTIVNIGAPPE